MRRTVLVATSVLALALASASEAQVSGRPARIGYLLTAAAEEQTSLEQAFVDAMRRLGYVQGKNLVLERRFAAGRAERLPELARELVQLKPDVIVTGANPVVSAVKAATTTIPIVMASSLDPVAAGFVASLRRPGGNITGLTNDPSHELQDKVVELLKQAMPSAARLGLLWNPVSAAAQEYRLAAEAAAAKLGFVVVVAEARRRDEFERAVAALARERIDALYVLSDPVLFTGRGELMPVALKHRLPVVGRRREWVDAGAFLAYGPSLVEQFGRAASYVDKILKGAKPAEMPVEQPTRFELAINLKTAQSLGLALPQTLRLRADYVVE